VSARTRGIGVGLLLAVAPVLEAPLGRMGPAFGLLLVLPPLAVSLEALGWSARAALVIRRVRSQAGRVVAAYVAWLTTSALLSLDVSAVGAATVALAVSPAGSRERRGQIGAAIVGSNVGSLLFPFSNLTNLVLVTATGIGFGAYVSASILPQLVAALAGGVLLAGSVRRPAPGGVDIEAPHSPRPGSLDLSSAAGGAIAAVASVAAVAIGFGGGDVVISFAIASGAVTAIALAAGRTAVGTVARTLPIAGLTVVLGATALAGPLAALAARLPPPTADVSGVVLAAVAGGALAAIVNNLPAAAAGSFWLAGASPHVVVAYLIGTNVAAIATPHGSVATMLARATAARGGVELSTRSYLRDAWRFALAPSVAAVAVLLVAGR
jgi:arsenical pump membrane protein